jgi:hypothetical protein
VLTPSRTFTLPCRKRGNDPTCLYTRVRNATRSIAIGIIWCDICACTTARASRAVNVARYSWINGIIKCTWRSILHCDRIHATCARRSSNIRIICTRINSASIVMYTCVRVCAQLRAYHLFERFKCEWMPIPNSLTSSRRTHPGTQIPMSRVCVRLQSTDSSHRAHAIAHTGTPVCVQKMREDIHTAIRSVKAYEEQALGRRRRQQKAVH